MHTGHRERIAAGVSFDWQTLPPLEESLDDVPAGVEALHFRRVKKSHRGISRLRGLKTLWAHGVDQDFLEEISALRDLETLYVDGLTAADLLPLGRNSSLRRLILIGGTRVPDLLWLRSLPAELKVLFLERFTRCFDLSPLTALPRLESLGFEPGTGRRIIGWFLGFATIVLAIALIAAFRLPQMAGVAVAEGIGAAGFTARFVDTRGLIHLPQRDVVEMALPHPIAMPLVDLGDVRARLLQRYGWIRDARVSRRWPDTIVVDIVAEMRAFGADVDVHDPRVDAREAHREFDLALLESPSHAAYDAVVLAVPHREFLDAGVDALRAYGRDGAVIYDVKGALPRDVVDGRL